MDPHAGGAWGVHYVQCGNENGAAIAAGASGGDEPILRPHHYTAVED